MAIRARVRVKRAARWAVQATIDARHWLRGERDPMVPPTRLMFDGPQNRAVFIQNGEDYFRYFRELLDIRPDDAVLDLGCGLGRKARPLARHLSEKGRYLGLDPTLKGLEWCRRHIATRHPNFEFAHIDVYNEHYNPRGGVRATELVLPVADASFDVAVLGSVFTHMLPDEVDHYLAELSRAVRSGGRTLISYFLLNPESMALMSAGAAAYDFPYRRGVCAIGLKHDPEERVAYDESAVREMCLRHGFEIIEPIRYGNWSGRESAYDFQDIVVASRLPSPG